MKKGMRTKAAAAETGKTTKQGGKKVITTAQESHETAEERYDENHPSRLRRGVVSISEIRELSNFLLESVQSLNVIAQKMEKIGIKEFDRVDGVTKGNRGKRLIAEFSANLNRSLIDQRAN